MLALLQSIVLPCSAYTCSSVHGMLSWRHHRVLALLWEGYYAQGGGRSAFKALRQGALRLVPNARTQLHCLPVCPARCRCVPARARSLTWPCSCSRCSLHAEPSRRRSS